MESRRVVVGSNRPLLRDPYCAVVEKEHADEISEDGKWHCCEGQKEAMPPGLESEVTIDHAHHR